MRIFPLLIVVTLLCLLPSDINGENKVRKKRAVPIGLLLKFTLPVGKIIFKGLRNIWKRTSETKPPTVMKELLELSKKLTNLENELKATVQTAVTTLQQTFPKAVKLELILHDLTLIKNQINFAEEQMRIYLTKGFKNDSTTKDDPFANFRNAKPLKPSDYTLLEEPAVVLNRTQHSKRVMEKFTMIDFATWATGHSFNSLMSLLRRMHDLVVREGKKGLFEQISDVSMEMRSNVCGLKYSPYQTLYNMYTSVALAELKGNTVLQFAYTILKMYNKGNFSTESQIAVNRYAKNAEGKIEALLKVLPATDRTTYNCDAPKHVDGKTYTYLVRFLQAYIENEVNLNRRRSCKKSCRSYSPRTRYYGCFKGRRKFCSKQPRCRGPVLNCRSASRSMRICRSSRKDRRYDWIRYRGGKVYGKGGYCWDRNYFRVNSWRRYLFWRCSYCVCICDDKSWESERYFNLRNVTSDVQENKIVTGVRIVKKNQLIHLQIQQGVMNPQGTVNLTTVSWKPLDNYTVWDRNVRNYKDYFTMDHEWRALDTNELTALPGYVITGIRFRKRGSHVDLDVHVTPFNFTTGQLELVPSNHSYWIASNSSHPQTGKWRGRISLWKPDVPIGQGAHSLNSKKNQYILFQPTDYKKDASQSTVPYFDSQPLTSDGFALSGFGLIHRGKSGSGGFIAPKLVSYDFAAHLNFTNTG